MNKRRDEVHELKIVSFLRLFLMPFSTFTQDTVEKGLENFPRRRLNKSQSLDHHLSIQFRFSFAILVPKKRSWSFHVLAPSEPHCPGWGCFVVFIPLRCRGFSSCALLKRRFLNRDWERYLFVAGKFWNWKVFIWKATLNLLMNSRQSNAPTISGLNAEFFFFALYQKAAFSRPCDKLARFSPRTNSRGFDSGHLRVFFFVRMKFVKF